MQERSLPYQGARLLSDNGRKTTLSVRRWAWTLLLFGCLDTVRADSPTKVPSQTSIASTCPYKTINYITHGLPKQCLTASRNTTGTATAVASVTLIDSPLMVSHASDAELSVVSSATVQDVESESYNEKSQTITPASETVSPSENPAQASETHSTGLPELTDEESPLESGNFLSFEEWKKQSLKKAGQSEHVGNVAKPELYEGRKRITNVQSDLDSLGDDVEIDLDFSGLVPGGPEQPIRQQAQTQSEQPGIPESDLEGPPKIRSRSKDAGTTCKERFNYASFDCAANVLKTNPAAKSPLSVLGENKDSYMLNECSAENKFIILELCNDISIDTIVLANFEFFSSTFRTFRVSVSDRYPVKIDKWKTLGVYEARNTREVQAFLVENPVIWARYLRIEFLTHYGNEFYCPVSLVRVHGTTMLEEYKHDLEAGTADDPDDLDTINAESDAGEDALVPEAIAEPIRVQSVIMESEPAIAQVEQLNSQAEISSDFRLGGKSASNGPEEALQSTYVSALEAIMYAAQTSETCFITDAPSAWPTPSADSALDACAVSCSPALTTSTASGPASSIPATATSTAAEMEVKTAAKTHDQRSVNETVEAAPLQSIPQSSTSNEIPVAVQSVVNSSEAQRTIVQSSERPTDVTVSTDRTKSSPVGTQPQPAMPTMQESFFKSVQKRLQMLESNSTLSLQYIEDQSRALRDAFKKVEQRQLSKTTSFLDSLNSTVLSELREFRQQYDQLWQSTVIELEMQRERYERDNDAINARLRILADEIVFQRRIGILQMILIMVCLVLVLFSRGAIHNYLELPLVQNVLARSPSSRWINLSGTETPSRPPPMTRTKSAHQLRTESDSLKVHHREPSDDSNAGNLSANDAYSPPTPLSLDDHLSDQFAPD